jgi:RNA recognition motif-containing protein
LEEIFGEYGKVTGLDLPLFKVCKYPLDTIVMGIMADGIAGLNRGKAAIEFSNAEEADKAVKHMNGGQLDGSFLTIQVSPLSPAKEGKELMNRFLNIHYPLLPLLHLDDLLHLLFDEEGHRRILVRLLLLGMEDSEDDHLHHTDEIGMDLEAVMGQEEAEG